MALAPSLGLSCLLVTRVPSEAFLPVNSGVVTSPVLHSSYVLFDATSRHNRAACTLKYVHFFPLCLCVSLKYSVPKDLTVCSLNGDPIACAGPGATYISEETQHMCDEYL
jgi:hypothetical protein